MTVQSEKKAGITKTVTHILGYPRIGSQRELKFAQERYWRGEIDQSQLKNVGQELRHRHWNDQLSAGLDYVAVGDFAWYDHVLGTSMLLGHIPSRHQQGFPDLDTLFTVARGKAPTGCVCAAADMTKWFNTNYHYIVPEFTAEDSFNVSWQQLFEEVAEAKKAGHNVKPVLLGPVSYLWLGKEKQQGFDRLTLLPRLLTAYQQILTKLTALGVEWVQVDEPALALELPSEWTASFKLAYQVLHGGPKLLLTTYFDDISHQLATISQLNVDGLHIDLSAAPAQLSVVADAIPNHWVLSAGVINGRNVWRADLAEWLVRLQPLKQQLGRNLWLASSCSLLHSPIDVESETELDEDVRKWLAFAKQKCHEITLLAQALDGEQSAIAACSDYSVSIKARLDSERVHNTQVQQRTAAITPQLAQRALPYAERTIQQQHALQLPLLPTTTIGSFPQTTAIRSQRSDFKAGRITEADYHQALEIHIQDAIIRQHNLGLDVLVHGEAERNDMVEYFAEQLEGFVVTQYGWVQSYGSRCVKPAIIVSDIYRAKPITVDWIRYAQSLTTKPVKGMLTGPVTILGWTFAREDLSREAIANQIALALRDEVTDLQTAGINIIQIDEPAIREGLPLKQSQWQAYLDWAVQAFKISAAGAAPQTQIHTHMCYSEFNQIIASVAALDADVITIETSRSDMELLTAFEAFAYPNEIGPGVYDIHSPNIPEVDTITGLIDKAAALIPIERLWINPDCGLKTRNWTETEAALTNMVTAAHILREKYREVTAA
ncbi:5-methyltetrahydropteroyltriglutamate--homocysteine S-methyltransferase [Photobacterium aquimaris]|uniref:5-methyltetrahydropteroyltriglutamate--homocysteine methyltransferase n=1 Tax=Photobacterium aquimaris TaxID=512643 RepID=A0A2T3HUN1_9GAMM|nr:5-methyltetrahydropteroyltriglutamate--homocysteine S-methyltransferase [Photobacterium aquimaris]OBU22919.1 5-methyltetrahydropteroyltriglutamate--homocysteine S-methyltransferase [Photobacterium aquimaris]PQJ41414.1 5-methyltetrahydropteroyltriglutamate--homocysteine S-methyltransferase [Photobacterium aquimaris]PSU01082.1 5-methyltetrahydropteroyltriglutamate--homocysteine S-methyltransferase [Photobacterium aquimaris]